MAGLIFELVEAVKLDEQGAVANHLKQKFTRSIHNRGQQSTLYKCCCFTVVSLGYIF